MKKKRLCRFHKFYNKILNTETSKKPPFAPKRKYIQTIQKEMYFIKKVMPSAGIEPAFSV